MNNLGRILKYKRLEKNIKQDQLCEGICTPSYLSRIENNRLVADKEIYKLLFERLGIDFEYILKINSETDERIERWYKEIIEIGKSNEIVGDLAKITHIVGGRVSLKFEIVHCRYLLMNNQVDSVTEKLQNLHQVIDRGSNRYFYLYSTVLLLYFLKKKEYSTAVDIAKDLIKIKGFESLGNDTELGIFYHNLALCYKNLFLYERASFYAKYALNIFKNNYDLEKAMNCHIIFGTCLINMSKWEEAIKTYTLARKLLEYLPEKVHNYYLKMINNNLGNCFEYQKKYQRAIQYYIQALNYIEKEDANIVLLNIIRCNFYLGDYNEVRHWLDKAIRSVNDNTSTMYTIQYEIFRVIVSEILTVDKIVNIQKSSINFFLSNEHWKLTSRYSELFAHLYESFSNYKKANTMYKLSFQIKSTQEVIK